MVEPDQPAEAGRKAGCSGDNARVRELVRAAGAGDDRARERVVAAHLDLVRGIASHYRNFGVPYDDLVQEGSLGLLEAIEQFDPKRSPDFERFARFRVRRAVRAALTDQSRVVRLPKHIVERRRAIHRTATALRVATGRTPTVEELAEATGLSPDTVLDANAAGIEIVSLDEPALSDGSSLSTVMADPAASDPQDELLRRERVARLRSGLDALPPRQRAMVVRHWGLDGAPTTTSELASELHVSAGRVRAIANSALYALRTEFEPRPDPASSTSS